MLVLLKVLHSYLHGDLHIQSLLSENILYVLPVVNIDGYKLIDEVYKTTGRLIYKRKTQNREYEKDIFGDYECDEEEAGVDLNRNYAWAFGNSWQGSSEDPCDETFRGPYPFSEPETKAMRDFIGNHSQDLKIIFNFHTYGNLFLHPFSSDSFDNDRLVKEYPKQARIYREIWEDNMLPYGNIKGNGERTVAYRADGEAADWILSEHGIIASSPELGTTDRRSYQFFIMNRTVLLDILN
jgi:Zinc carboxypeptidase